MMASAPLLATLRLGGNLIDLPASVTQADIVIMPSLISLSLAFNHEIDGVQYICSFFRATSMPNLEELVFNDLRHDLTQFVQAVRTSTRTPFFPKLTSLNIDCESSSGWEVDSSFFESLPKIREFIYTNDHPDTWKILTSFHNDFSCHRVPWPDLKEVQVPLRYRTTLDALCELVCHRNFVRKPIRVLQLIEYGCLPFADHAESIELLRSNVGIVYMSYACSKSDSSDEDMDADDDIPDMQLLRLGD